MNGEVMKPRTTVRVAISVMMLGLISGCSGTPEPDVTGSPEPTSADGASATFTNGYEFARSADVPAEMRVALEAAPALSNGDGFSLKMAPAVATDLGDKQLVSFLIDTSAMPASCPPDMSANGAPPADAPCFTAVLLTGDAANYDPAKGYKYEKVPGAEVVPLTPMPGGELITVTSPGAAGKTELAVLGGSVMKSFNVDVLTGEISSRPVVEAQPVPSESVAP